MEYGNDGPPSPSRDRGGIGRRDKNVTELLYRIVSVTEALALKPSKSGLGQGIMGFGKLITSSFEKMY